MADESADSCFVVAIDGGAASGKSTTARALSQRCGMLHVDTGSHYRALTARLLAQGVEPTDHDGLSRALEAVEIGLAIDGGAGQITIDGVVPEPSRLRSDAINASVSAFAAQPMVRKALKAYQQSLATAAETSGFAGLVMEGRDIGTVIYPDAPVKVFLEADLATRTARRAAEGQTDAVTERDRQDSARKTAPLTAAPDALHIDTGALGVDAVVARIMAEIDARRQSSVDARHS